MLSEVERIFKDAGALLQGHFLLASGRHSPVYWEKFRILQHPEYTVKLCSIIAEHFRPQNIHVVAGPTLGGTVLAFEVARQLGVTAAYAEKADGSRAFRRGVSISRGGRVLIVDDILTTGASVQDVVAAVQEKGGVVVAVAVLVDRSDEGVDLGFPLFACLRSASITYAADACPLCHQGNSPLRLGGLA